MINLAGPPNNTTVEGLNLKKRIVMLTLVAVLLVLTFAGAFVSGCKPEEGEKQLRIAMVFQVPYIDFFVPTRIGATDAAKEYGIDFVFMGPESPDYSKQIAMIETLLLEGIDGLVVQAIEPSAVLPVVERVRAEGIPVIVTNELVEQEGFDGFCGSDPQDVGLLMAQQLEKILLGEGPWVEATNFEPREEVSGEVGYSLDLPGSQNLEKRILGAKEYLENFPGIVDIGKYDFTESVDQGKEVMDNIITANPNLTGFIPVGSGPTVAAGMAVKDRGLTGKIVVVGMDLLPHTLKLVQEKVIACTIGQNPYDQGYLPVKALAEYLLNGVEIPKFMPTELEVVDLTNVDEIMEREVNFLEEGTKLGK
jgi:ABC-type sugar transport system substrate-binding protein